MPDSSRLSRRSFMGAMPVAVPLAGASLVGVSPAAAARRVVRRADGGLADGYPAHDPEVVSAVVGSSHGNYERVHELVTARPELAKVAWDWGFGDWESALGAASHMGRRDIAELLIGHGARPNLYTFAMLGQVDVVRATCRANPGIQGQPGPHGITLMRHAIHGGDAARDVVAYLEELGGADVTPSTVPLAEDTARAYAGDYVPDGAEDVVFRVKFHERRKGLTLQRDERQFRFLLHHGEHAFSPGGAPSVRVVFDAREDGLVSALELRDGPVVVRARRLLD